MGVDSTYNLYLWSAYTVAKTVRQNQTTSNTGDTTMFTTYRFTLEVNTLPALINGDFSGLEDNEAQDIDHLDTYVREMYGAGHWAVPDTDAAGYANKPEFVEDELTGLKGNCIEVHYMARA